MTGIAEVFNAFNHENYGAYNGQVNSTTFGEPRQNLLNAYQPRVMQLAFRARLLRVGCRVRVRRFSGCYSRLNSEPSNHRVLTVAHAVVCATVRRRGR